MAGTFDFETAFLHLTGDSPFPWQQALDHEWFKLGNIPPLASLPTSVGKTRVIAIWLIALALRSPLPRRLVYVVNRRTVIDRTTKETEQLRKRLASQPSRSSKSSELPPRLPKPRRSRSRSTLVQPEGILASATGRAQGEGVTNERFRTSPMIAQDNNRTVAQSLTKMLPRVHRLAILGQTPTKSWRYPYSSGADSLTDHANHD
jgi:hypothetical protein